MTSLIRRRRTARSDLPPLILLGGDANAVSIARSLVRDGITVHMIGASPARRSRAIRPIPMKPDAGPSDWTDYLLGPPSDGLRGSVLLAANDAGLELLATHRQELRKRFLLDDSNPSAQLCMLDKLCTYQAAVNSGVPTPRFWPLGSFAQLNAIRTELVYPLIVKPRLSHVFRARFGRKFFLAESFAQVVTRVQEAFDAGVDVLLMEMIPGPDNLLCSYYTYLDEGGLPNFDFTKRVIRRYPVNMGEGTYHVTDYIPELRPLATALFRQVGLRGLAAAEFKLDTRDGTLKLIECNARFTAANHLLSVAGFDLGRWVYYRIIGRPLPVPSSYASGAYLWSPVTDFRAFLQLRAGGQLSTLAWIRTLLHRQSFAWFDWRDPVPSLLVHGQQLARFVRTLARR